MNLITIVGARPQFIKAAAVSAALASTAGVSERLLHTGQHFDDNMSDVFFRELGIPLPTWNLGLGGGSHGAMTGAQLAGIEQVLIDERPDAVLLYGDTNSTLAGALAAANLQREGVDAARVHQVGDVMYDAALQFSALARARAVRHPVFAALARRPFVLATVHRAENTDEPERLRVIVDALVELARETDVVWPLHPRTRKVLAQRGAVLGSTASLHCVEPLGYLDMIEMEQAAALVVTDSGGVQKETFFFGRPCVTLRDETEWIELVAAGWNRLARPTSVAALMAAFHAALGSVGEPVRPYGNGDAAQRIARVLTERPA